MESVTGMKRGAYDIFTLTSGDYQDQYGIELESS